MLQAAKAAASVKTAFGLSAAIVAVFALPAQAQIVGGRTVRVSSQPLSQPFNYQTAGVTRTLEGRLVALMSDDRDGELRLFAQRLDEWGHRFGSEIEVARPILTNLPRIGATGAGGFVAVWVRPDATVQARCYDRDGIPGLPFTVGAGYGPDVSFDAAGRFVVAWAEAGDGVGPLFARLYSPSCVALGPAFTVTATAAPIISNGPVVAVGADGRFVVAWEEPDGSLSGIFARRYAADGTPLGGAFVVNSNTASYQARSSASMAADGSFVVTWLGQGIFARRFDPLGAPVGPDFTVRPGTEYPTVPEVAHTSGGEFVVAWLDTEPSPILTARVALRHYTAAGVPGPVVDGGSSYLPIVALGMTGGPDGFAALAWLRRDGPQEEVVVRRFGPLAAEALVIDGNGILEPGEDVAAAPAWRNGAGAPITLAGTATSFDGPGAPGVAYTLIDASASYGAVADGAVASCAATGDCYRLGVSAPSARPALHWDGRLDEMASGAGGAITHGWLVHVGASFTDVPAASAFYPFVETILHAGVTAGCAGATYCPTSSVTREQMAVFVLRSRHEGYQSRACTGTTRTFTDVPAASPFCPWIEDLARRGVVGGCDGTRYCPAASVSREEMAVFMLAAKEDSGYDPPACASPMFADVPASSPFCPWIEELARRGVVAGCGGGNYCPAQAVSREQMAVFLSVSFGLVLYGP